MRTHPIRITALAVVGPGGLAWSGDGGRSWTTADTVSHWAVAFAPSGEGWAVGPGGRIVALSPRTALEVSPPLFAGDVLISGGRLFDGTGDASVPNPGILLRDGRIRTIGLSVAEGEIAGPAAPEVVVLRVPDGATILPGLFDLHAHYAVDIFGEGRVDETLVNPLVFLANGVTSTFPAGEVDPSAFDGLEAALRTGETRGPRLHRSGAYFGSARPGWDHEAMTPDSIRAEVVYWAGRGVVGFKAKGIRPAPAGSVAAS